MGYHLRILRSAGEPAITPQEFAAAVRATPSLVLDDDGFSARFIQNKETRATIFFHDGEVWTNMAEEDVLQGMIFLAHSLNARVRGDYGESYRSLTETYVHPDDAADVAARASRYQHWQRRNLIWNVLRFGVLLGVLVWITVRIRSRLLVYGSPSGQREKGVMLYHLPERFKKPQRGPVWLTFFADRPACPRG
jgi:hypothetical protein